MSKFYIAIDVFGWCQKDDFFDAIKGREEDSGKPTNLNVFEVDGDPKMLYSFKFFTPQIPGATLVFSREIDMDKNVTYEFPDIQLDIKTGDTLET